MFLNLFGGIILIYSYILMSRIESSRRNLEQHSRVDALTGLLNRRALYESKTKLGCGGLKRVDLPPGNGPAQSAALT